MIGTLTTNLLSYKYSRCNAAAAPLHSACGMVSAPAVFSFLLWAPPYL